MEDVYDTPFTAADHTKLVRAVLEHPLHVIKYLNVPNGQSPTTLQVIDAALQVKSFDAGTKARLQEARAGYLRFEEERAKDSASFTEHLERVHAALDGKSIADMIAALDDLLAQGNLDDRSAAGLEFAKAILVDGADSIYSPDFSVSELLETAASGGAQQAAQVDATLLLPAEEAQAARQTRDTGRALTKWPKSMPMWLPPAEEAQAAAPPREPGQSAPPSSSSTRRSSADRDRRGAGARRSSRFSRATALRSVPVTPERPPTREGSLRHALVGRVTPANRGSGPRRSAFKH